MLGPMGGHEPCEHVNCTEPGITRGDAVVPVGFERGKELGDTNGGQVRDIETFDGALRIAGSELQQ